MTHTAPKRPWFQWSLRTIFAVVAVVAVWVAVELSILRTTAPYIFVIGRMEAAMIVALLALVVLSRLLPRKERSGAPQKSIHSIAINALLCGAMLVLVSWIMRPSDLPEQSYWAVIEPGAIGSVWVFVLHLLRRPRESTWPDRMSARMQRFVWSLGVYSPEKDWSHYHRP